MSCSFHEISEKSVKNFKSFIYLSSLCWFHRIFFQPSKKARIDLTSFYIDLQQWPLNVSFFFALHQFNFILLYSHLQDATCSQLLASNSVPTSSSIHCSTPEANIIRGSSATNNTHSSNQNGGHTRGHSGLENSVAASTVVNSSNSTMVVATKRKLQDDSDAKADVKKVHRPQCGNYIIFLSLIFYVKSN